MAEPYRVVRPRVSGQPPFDEPAAEKTSPRPRAVLVAHGMGQQVRFQTLDDVARGLCTEIEKRNMTVEQRTALTVRVGCKRLQRLELTLKTKDGSELPSVHLYEAYWAPLTEGAIGLWQTVLFLLNGGWNGIRSDAKLHRFMFGKSRAFCISRGKLTLLWIAILTVIAMVVVGGTIAGVGISRFTFAPQSRWITDQLIRDLTVLFELLLGAVTGGLFVAAAIIALGRAFQKRQRSKTAEKVLWLVVIPAAAIILALWLSAYVAIPTFLLFDKWHAVFAWPVQLLRRAVAFLLRYGVPELVAWWSLFGTAVAVLGYAAFALLTRRRRMRRQGGRIAGLVLATIAVAVVLTLCRSDDGIAFVTWLVLFGAVLFVRRFLIQYLGDVAIYVCSHLVDRFFDLRDRIRAVVWSAARVVYAFRDADGKLLYDDVVVAGHSLGSAVVYDTLNRLIDDDDLAVAGDKTRCGDEEPLENLDVLRRTRLLLTFGSPLDKFAFIFSERHPGGDRDALSTAKQPLIARERPDGFQWVNVYSPFDILGGKLDFYDTPKPDKPCTDDPGGPENKNRIDNKSDPNAITPIAAHTEFWKNRLIYQTIVDALNLDGRRQ